MARTARDLVQAAGASAGIVDPGAILSDEDAVTALAELNNIVEMWNLDSLFPNTKLEYTVPSPTLVDGVISIGPTSGSVDVVAPRPNRVVAVATLRDGRYYALDYLSPETVARSDVRNNTNQGTHGAYYTVYMDYPDIRIKLFPQLSATEYLVTTDSIITNYTLNDDLTLPSGYFPALQYELATVLAINYGNVDMVPLLQSRAKEAISRVKRLNNKGQRMSHEGTPGMGRREVDIRSGSWI